MTRTALLRRLVSGEPSSARRHDRDVRAFEHRHRDLRGGGLRAAIFGASDGLVSNVSLVLGTAGAHPGAGVVRLAGLAGLFGGSFSMAAGEYVSMRAQQEAFRRELELERVELQERPEFERRELERIYVACGVAPDVASNLAGALMANPEMALDTHAREELGIDPHALGAPVQAGVTSFLTFGLGAFVPLIAFLGGSSGTKAIVISIILTSAAALGVGTALSLFTHRSRLFSALRSFLICAIAGAITYGIGTAIGVAAK